MVKDYFEARAWLEGFIPYTYSKENLGLSRIEYLLKLLGNPQEKFKSIHIAGTSGKGSTAYYCVRLLQRSKSQTPNSKLQKGPNNKTKNWNLEFDNWKLNRPKVGLHISPHLTYIGERMQINGRPISVGRLVKLINEVKTVVEKIQRTKPKLIPSYFEILVAASFLHFAQERVNWAVVEVGLGGRLDATNVLRPELCVITNIGLDHTDILGKTIEKIAFEKAGIIKDGVPVITGAKGKALQVIEKEAERKKAQLVKLSKNDTKGYLIIYKDIVKRGECFLTYECFSMSLTSMGALGILLDRDTMKEALSLGFPGRFEEVQEDVILDGAHNLDKIKILVNFLKNSKLQTPNSKITLVVAFKKGKDWKKMLRFLISELSVDAIFATEFKAATDTGFFAAVDPYEIKDFVNSKLPFDSKLAQGEQISNSKIIVTNNSQEAVFNALRLTSTSLSASAQGKLVLVTGSLYLVGEARTLWDLPEN